MPRATCRYRAGECVWYIANFVISVTLGLVILTGYVRVHEIMVDRYELTYPANALEEIHRIFRSHHFNP